MDSILALIIAILGVAVFTVALAWLYFFWEREDKSYEDDVYFWCPLLSVVLGVTALTAVYGGPLADLGALLSFEILGVLTLLSAFATLDKMISFFGYFFIPAFGYAIICLGSQADSWIPVGALVIWIFALPLVFGVIPTIAILSEEPPRPPHLQSYREHIVFIGGIFAGSFLGCSLIPLAWSYFAPSGFPPSTQLPIIAFGLAGALILAAVLWRLSTASKPQASADLLPPPEYDGYMPPPPAGAEQSRKEPLKEDTRPRPDWTEQ
jgi:hypothetical protein